MSSKIVQITQIFAAYRFLQTRIHAFGWPRRPEQDKVSSNDRAPTRKIGLNILSGFHSDRPECTSKSTTKDKPYWTSFTRLMSL